MANMRELLKKNGWSLHCNLCGKDVFKHPLDYFMLKDKIWNKITNNDYISQTHVLCRHCAEEILGREFVDEDFINAPINYEYFDDGTKVLKNQLYKMEEEYEL